MIEKTQTFEGDCLQPWQENEPLNWRDKYSRTACVLFCFELWHTLERGRCFM